MIAQPGQRLQDVLGRAGVRDALAEYLEELRRAELEDLARAGDTRMMHIVQGRAAAFADLHKILSLKADRTGGTR